MSSRATNDTAALSVPVSCVSCVSWHTLRDVYSSHFGALAEVDTEPDFRSMLPPEPLAPPGAEAGSPAIEPPAVEPRGGEAEPGAGEPDIAYYALSFAAPSSGCLRTCATFGAGPLIGGHELFWRLPVPFPSLDAVPFDLALRSAPLGPGQVVPLAMDDLPFEAVWLAPAAAGSISLGFAGGAERFALLMVPLTAAEERLARGSPDELLRRLRQAGALAIVDPLRPCVVDPAATRAFWTAALPRLLAREERRLKDEREWVLGLRRLTDRVRATTALRGLHAPAEALAMYLRAKQACPELAPGPWAARYRSKQELMGLVMKGVEDLFEDGLVPCPLRDPCMEVLAIVLRTHPVAARLCAEVAGWVTRPFDHDRWIADVAEVVRFWRPGADAAKIMTAGFAVADELRRRACRGLEGNPMLEWEDIAGVMCVEEERYPFPLSRLAEIAYAAGLAEATGAFAREDGERLPLARLQEGLRRIAVQMIRLWNIESLDNRMLERFEEAASLPAEPAEEGWIPSTKKQPSHLPN